MRDLRVTEGDLSPSEGDYCKRCGLKLSTAGHICIEPTLQIAGADRFSEPLNLEVDGVVVFRINKDGWVVFADGSRVPAAQLAIAMRGLAAAMDVYANPDNMLGKGDE